MRKHPPIPTLNRECVNDYKIPESNTIIKKGTSVLIPALGLHHDEDYFPNSQKFDPERFNEQNRGTIPSHAYLPFGEGPRNCVGGFYCHPKKKKINKINFVGFQVCVLVCCKFWWVWLRF